MAAVVTCRACAKTGALCFHKVDSAPFVRGSDTSEAAARSVRDRVAGDKRRIVALVAAAPDGLTQDEVDVATGMGHSTSSARCSDLVAERRLVDSGRRRATRSGCKARVLVVNPEWKVEAT